MTVTEFIIGKVYHDSFRNFFTCVDRTRKCVIMRNTSGKEQVCTVRRFISSDNHENITEAIDLVSDGLCRTRKILVLADEIYEGD